MPVERCPICGGQLEQKQEEFQHVYRGVPIRLSEVTHQVCTDCGEVLVDGQFGKIIEESIDQYRQSKQYEYDDLLTGEEVAGLLAVSYQVVLAMLSDGKLPGTKVGREWRIHHGVLMEYIQGMCASNLSQPEREIHQAFAELRRNHR